MDILSLFPLIKPPRMNTGSPDVMQAMTEPPDIFRAPLLHAGKRGP